jgi:hypothetical protein
VISKKNRIQKPDVGADFGVAREINISFIILYAIRYSLYAKEVLSFELWLFAFSFNFLANRVEIRFIEPIRKIIKQKVKLLI